MRVLVGTSGWVYKDWTDRFYPSDIKQKDQLAYLARHFPTVEINSTFYHLPTANAAKNWHDSVPNDFVFSVKLSRYLTHTLRMKQGADLDESLDTFCARIKPLGDKLGAVLVQLPASFAAKPERIENLASQTRGISARRRMTIPLACEFRHASWFEEPVFDLLSRLGIACVIASGPGRWPETRRITADFAFIRFHGDARLYASSYSKAELDKWAAFIRRDCRGCRRVFCYFNNDKSAKAIDNARYLAGRFTGNPGKS